MGVIPTTLFICPPCGRLKLALELPALEVVSEQADDIFLLLVWSLPIAFSFAMGVPAWSPSRESR
jgi:hypothetical protein